MRRLSGFVHWLKTCKPKLFASIKVSIVAFFVDFLPDLLGWLGDVREWASGSPDEFPAVDPLWKALIAAGTAALVGLVLYVYNSLRPVSAPEYISPPRHPARPRDRGAADAYLVWLVALTIAVVFLYFDVYAD